MIGGMSMSLCPGCFEPAGGEPCPHCGYRQDARQSSLLLPRGALLRQEYLIGNILGSPGGFGITYLGYHRKLDRKVAVKEFLPRSIAGRGLDGRSVEAADAAVFSAGLEQFLREARLLAKFSHANIVRIIDFFEENATAYLVMEYYSGVTLVEHIDRSGGRLSEQAALALLLPVFDGLREVHGHGILHRDIKPQNIYITDEGRPILLDFGAARQTVEALSQGFSLLVTPGFAPVEQYDRQGRQGPWTDVYGCAATLYYMLTGFAPPDALSRMSNDSFHPEYELQQHSPGLLQALVKGLAVLPEDRLPSIAALQACLTGETVVLAPASAAAAAAGMEALTRPLPPAGPPTALVGGGETAELPDEPPPLRQKPRQLQRLRPVLLVLLLAAVAIAGWHWQTGGPERQLERRGVAFSEAAFFQAVKAGNREVVSLFLDAGYTADYAATGTGETALLTAVGSGQLAMVDYLISRGASLDRKDFQGQRPLDIALQRGDVPVLKLLMTKLQLGPDSRSEQGLSLLEQAVLAGSRESAAYLVAQGAGLNTVDQEGNTLLDRMSAAGNQQAVELLRSLGAERNVNKVFARGRLTEFKLPSSGEPGFEIDLLGNRQAQQLILNRQNSSRGTLAISQEGRLLAEVGNVREQRWYAAYLRGDVPDLIYFRLVGANFIEEVKIIGRTGPDTVGPLFSPDLGELRSAGLLRGQAGIELEGTQLVLYSGKNRAAVEWSPADQTFRLRKL